MACAHGACGHSIDQSQYILDHFTADAIGNKYDSCAMIAVGPVIKPRQRMHQLLCALNYRRASFPLGNANQPFDTKQPSSEVLRQCVKKEFEGCVGERFLSHNAKGLDGGLAV